MVFLEIWDLFISLKIFGEKLSRNFVITSWLACISRSQFTPMIRGIWKTLMPNVSA